ncbi:hypothetical protein SGFS_021370 [Streptomyces graminofaciens]|uniref:Uncharacterized protein n=2 Tax=Streptomyces graminofaciens TaxID=68212 RepID=A0ABN5VD24_9ACTN|nr:hypothetical protein SGFS_021370 [Streptomyces graminofaciens]
MWHMAITAAAPAPVLNTLLTVLASGDAWETALGTPAIDKTATEATRPLTDAGWTHTMDGRWLRWQSNQEDVGVQFDAFAAQTPHTHLDSWTIWPAPPSTTPPGPSTPPPTPPPVSSPTSLKNSRTEAAPARPTPIKQPGAKARSTPHPRPRPFASRRAVDADCWVSPHVEIATQTPRKALPTWILWEQLTWGRPNRRS